MLVAQPIVSGNPNPIPESESPCSGGSKLPVPVEHRSRADLPSQAVAVVAASSVRAEAGAQLVAIDVGPTDMPVLTGALYVDERRLAELVHGTHTPLLVAGRGYDDPSLARRLARWQKDSSAIKVVRGGLPALALRSGSAVSDQTLEKLLAVEATYQVALARRPDWTLLVLDEAVLPGSVTTSRVSGDLAQTVQALLTEAKAGVVLIDESGSASKAAAVRLSRFLRMPVFHFSGGAARLRSALAHFEALDRQPGGKRDAGWCLG